MRKKSQSWFIPLLILFAVLGNGEKRHASNPGRAERSEHASINHADVSIPTHADLRN